MLTPRRTAHFGIAATLIVLISSLSALIAKTIDANQHLARPGLSAPHFELDDLQGNPVSLTSLRGKVVVLYFTSVRCPACNDYAPRVIDLAEQYADNTNVEFVAIDSESLVDSPANLDEMRVQAKILGQTYPTLVDESGRVAKLYDAKRTPSFYVIGPRGVVRYRGAFDDNRRESQVKHTYVADALAALLANQPVATVAAATPGH